MRRQGGHGTVGYRARIPLTLPSLPRSWFAFASCPTCYTACAPPGPFVLDPLLSIRRQTPGRRFYLCGAGKRACPGGRVEGETPGGVVAPERHHARLPRCRYWMNRPPIDSFGTMPRLINF